MPQSKLAYITFLDGSGGYPDQSLPPGHQHPDQGLPGGSGGHPWLPGYIGSARPDNSLPGGGHGSTLPIYPFDPTRPDNSLPGGGGHPSTGPIVPGSRFIVKWLACQGLILVPDNELPETPEPK